jgi:hypothetical protein
MARGSSPVKTNGARPRTPCAHAVARRPRRRTIARVQPHQRAFLRAYDRTSERRLVRVQPHQRNRCSRRRGGFRGPYCAVSRSGARGFDRTTAESSASSRTMKEITSTSGESVYSSPHPMVRPRRRRSSDQHASLLLWWLGGAGSMAATDPWARGVAGSIPDRSPGDRARGGRPRRSGRTSRRSNVAGLASLAAYPSRSAPNRGQLGNFGGFRG